MEIIWLTSGAWWCIEAPGGDRWQISGRRRRRCCCCCGIGWTFSCIIYVCDEMVSAGLWFSQRVGGLVCCWRRPVAEWCRYRPTCAFYRRCAPSLFLYRTLRNVSSLITRLAARVVHIRLRFFCCRLTCSLSAVCERVPVDCVLRCICLYIVQRRFIFFHRLLGSTGSEGWREAWRPSAKVSRSL